MGKSVRRGVNRTKRVLARAAQSGYIEQLEQRVLMAASLSPFIPAHRFLFNQGKGLAGATAGKPLNIALNYISSHASALGVTRADVTNPIVTDQYTDRDTGITHIYFQQRVNKLPVDNTSINVNVTRDGRVLSVGGAFVANAATKVTALPKKPTIASRKSLQALKTLGLKVPVDNEITPISSGSSQFRVPSLSLDPIHPQLHYVMTSAGLTPTWEVVVRTPDRQHWYDTHVDAFSGNLLDATDWVDSASYDVYPMPIEAPNDGPGDTVPRSIVTNPADPVASPFGWHDTDGVAGAEFTDTRGNNVSAQEDADANNTGGFRPDGTASLNFDFPIDFTQAPSSYRSAAITNLFYWNNLLHDIHYQYGFTEVAGNFQVTNYSGQGIGNDAVQADAQDGSGTNNANFATPPDGQAPRMQMYLFNYTSPNRDGDLDNGIIIHEYGHGVSNRLTGGPANSNALNATQSGGMGEGWSDWWALMFSQDASDTKLGAYPAGTYVLGQTQTGAGIRRKPYSFDMALDPLTIDAYGISGSGGGVTRSTEVHNSGEIWATTLWDLNWLLIDKYGYSPTVTQGYDPAVSGKNGGNNLALQLVMDGLKLQPANPSFKDARDAILLADQIRTGGANQYQIWTAFARRGMGFSFVDSSSSATSVTPAFDVPAGLLNPSVISQTPTGISTTPISSLDLTFSKAMDPASFSLGSDINSFTGPGGSNLLGQLTGSSWTNSNQTLHLTFNPQSSNGLYTLSLGPQILAASDGHAMDQNANGTPGEVGDVYVATFRYDALAGQVTSTVPVNASLVQVPLTTIDFNFNEPFSPASVTASDLTLSQGSVASVNVVDADTVRFNLSGVISEGTLNFNIAAGAINDADGNPMTAYAGTLALDAATTPFPTPLTVKGVLGALIYEGSTSATLGTASDTDSFTLVLDANQALTVLIDPSAGLRPVVEVRDAGNNLIGSASSTATGLDALLQSVPIAVAGTYTITVGSVGAASSGAYTVKATLNSALEAENQNGASNDTLGTAQNLNGALIKPTGGTSPSIASVLGKTPSAVGTVVYSEGFESGSLGPAWSTYSSTVDGRIQVSNSNGAAAGTYALMMDNGADSGSYVLNEAVWTVDLTAVPLPTLTFSSIIFSDETDVMPADFTGHANGDGVAISSNGTNWHTIWTNSSPSSWTPVTVDLAAAAAAAGMTLGPGFKIKFQQYDNFAITTDGRGYDAISITTPSSNSDYYSFSLTAGESVALGGKVLPGSSANLVVQLLNSSGTVLASGVSAANFNNVIASYTVPTDGVYYAYVTGDQASDYELTLVRKGTLDIESNNTIATAQPIAKSTNVFGSVVGGGVISSIKMGLIEDIAPWTSLSNTAVATGLGYTVTLIPASSLGTVDFSAFNVVVLAGDQTNTTYTAVQSNMGRIESYVAGGGVWITNDAAGWNGGSPYSYDLLPGAPGLSIVDSSGSAIDVLAPTSGLITGPGGTITNSTLDGGTSSNHGYTTSLPPAGGVSILSTATSSQVVAMDYPYFGGHVIFHTIPVEFYGGTGNFGIFHKNLFNFGASFVSGANDDYYKVTLNAGEVLNLKTTTPGDGPGEFGNTLDPMLEIFNPGGTKVSFNDNGAPDGRNASLIYVAPTAGTYTIHVLSSPSGTTQGEYLLSVSNNGLIFTVPSDLNETAGVVSGTISIASAPASDLVVNLSSSDPTRLGVQATATILAGTTSAPISLTVTNNSLLDGPQSVVLSASAAGLGTTQSTVKIHDDETSTLSVNLPGTASEGAGTVSGTITSPVAPTRDITIQLTSSNTSRATVPATVTLLAGQTTANFNLTVLNNTLIDGSAPVTVTASTENWTSGTANVNITDNDATITVTLPASGWEGQTLSGQGTVTLGGTSGSNIVVNLLSADTTEMTVPATVTIPAGQTTATFTVTLPTDGIKDGAQTASVTGSSAGLASGSANIVVHDANLDHVAFDAISSPKTAAVAFSATARAFNIDNEVIAVYSSSGTLSATGQAGTLPITPTSTTFSAGVWTGSVTINAVDPTVSLGMVTGGLTGTSNVFALQPGPVTNFQWNTISTPQIALVPFPVTITAKDANGFTATGYNGTANLSGLVGNATSQTMLGNFTPDSSNNNGSYTVGYAFTPSKNIQVTHVRSYFGSKVSFWTNTGTLLGSQAVSGPNGSWTETTFSSPLTLNAGTTYRITVYTAAQTYHWRSTAPPAPSFATIGQTYEVSGDAFPTSTDTGQWWLVDLRGNVGTSAPVPVSPTSPTFSNGVWTGNVTAQQSAINMHLHIDDGASHVGDSNDFNVIQRTLSLTLPPDVYENDGSTAGLLTVSPAPASDLVVTLTNSKPGRLGIPTTITVPAGQTQVVVPVTILDNGLLDGMETAAITASASTYSNGSAAINIHDNESATLSINLPATAVEGVGSVSGTITSSAPAVNDVVVQLSSNNVNRATVPTTIILPAGQTSVPFTLTIVNNTIVDGLAFVSVSASVENWTSGFRSILISDNDNNLTLTLPAAGGFEGQTLTGAGTVRIGGTMATDLLIDLVSSDTTELTVPANVIIPAGQTSATFSLSLLTDGLKDGLQAVTLTASAPGIGNITSGNGIVQVHDADLDHFSFDTITGPKTAGVAFAVTARARNVNDELISLYAGSGTMSATGQGGGALPVTPTSLSFSSGIGTGNVAINAVDPAATLRVTGAGGALGTSNAFALQAGPVASFQWGTISSPKGANVPFPATITAKDANGFTANFNGTATLSGNIGGSSAPSNPGTAFNGARDFNGTTLSIGVAADGSFVGPSVGAKFSGVEYLRWGTYLAGFTVSFNGANYTNNIASAGGTAFPVTMEDISSGSLHGIRVKGTIASVMGFQRTIWWNDGDAYALVSTTLTNKSAGGINNVAILDNQDPDPGGNFSTTNDVIVNASGQFTVGSYSGVGGMALGSIDPRAVASAEGFTITDPFEVINTPVDPNNSVSDNALNMAFNIGALAAGQVTSATFAMVYGATPAAIQSAYAAAATKTASTILVPVNPTSATFVNGVWTGNISVLQPATNMFLAANDGAGHAGNSNTFNVTDQSLSITMPANVTEGSGMSVGKLAIVPTPAVDQYITLTSSNPSRVFVPPGVTIRAGQSYVSVPVVVIDNTILDGPEAVTISATLAGYAPFTGIVNVHDNESATLSVNVPANASEGAGTVTGTITSSVAPTRPITIQLSSNNTSRATVPATVTLPAGQTTASFNLSILNNTLIDGNQPVVISASTENWTGGNGSIDIVDNDTTITITLPPGGWEGQSLVGSGTVTLGGTAPSNVVVNLLSDDTSELTLPASVTVLAGQSSATFTLTLPTDAIKDGSQTATVTGSSAGFTSGSAGIVVHDADLDHLNFDPISGTKTAAVAFSTTARAYNIANELISAYGGSATLSATGQAGALPINPTTATFSGGVWTGNVAVSAVDPTVTISANAGGVIGTSNAFATQAGPVASFQWGTIASTIAAGIPFAVTLTAKDANGFNVNFNGTANLSGLTGVSIPITPGTATFVNGVWSGNVTVLQTANNMHLRVDDGAGHVGNSNNFNAIQLALIVSLPANAQETDGSASGTLNLFTAAPFDVVANLVSSDPSRVTVPATLTIPAGQTSVPLPLTILDNLLLDGPQLITITASSAGTSSGNGSITIHDNETASLSVSLPGSTGEGGSPVSGTITASAAPTRDITVQLLSGNPSRATVPLTVTLPAGQTTATFNLAVTDDTLINGTQPVTITASTENWTSGSTNININDNDGFITVSLPAGGWESQTLSGAGTVSIGGTLPTNLVVNLLSDDTTELTVPATVTILAGQTSATFNLTLLSDALKDGSQTATVTGSASGLTSGNSSMIIHDANLDHVNFDPITSPKTAAVAFSATANAYNIANELIAVYAGSAALNATGQAGSLPMTPLTGTFVNGVWTGNVTISALDPTVTLDITTGGVNGTSNVFALQAGSVASFQWSPISGSKEANAPFTVTTTALDAHGFIANFNGLVNLGGFSGIGVFIPVTPASVSFVNGVWTGAVSVTQVATGVHLHADDGSGHIGDSNTFDSVAGSPPAAPVVNPLPVYTAGTSQTITWPAVAGANQYYVDYATTDTFDSPLGNSGWISGTTYTFTGLTSGTTYYYRVQARRVFSVTADAFNQTSQGDFSADTQSKVSLTSNPGAVVLKLNQTSLFSDDFEDGNFNGWTVGAGTATRQVTNATAAQSSVYSLTINGATPLGNGINRVLSPMKPTTVEFSVRSSSTAAGASFILSTTTTYTNNQNVIAYFKSSGGYMQIVDGAAVHRTAFVANQWYNVLLTLDWATRKINYYVNGVLVDSNIPFLGTATSGIASINLDNAGGQAWWDEIALTTPPNSGYSPSGFIISPSISRTTANWGSLVYNVNTPPQTSITVDILNNSGAVLAANVPSGTSLASLGIVNATIKLRANLSTSDPAVSPALLDWTVDWTNQNAIYSSYSTPVSSTQDAQLPIVGMTSLETADDTPALSGTIDDPAAAVQVTVNGTSYPAVNDGSGHWLLADNVISPALTPGVYPVNVTATDPAGNIGSTSASLTILTPLSLESLSINDGSSQPASVSPALASPIGDGTAYSSTFSGLPAYRWYFDFDGVSAIDGIGALKLRNKDQAL